MYSVQHVLWRGAMALSLLVVGGVGASFATPEQERAMEDEGCVESYPAVAAQRVQPLPHYQLDVVVVNGAALPDEA